MDHGQCLPVQDSHGLLPTAASRATAPPSLQPFSESENPDAIALRSALSILQIQRQQTLRDLVALERQKKMALVDPDEFARAVSSGKVKTRSTGVLESASSFAPFDTTSPNQEEQVKSKSEDTRKQESSDFEDLPGPQSIVRCPPINWTKYHVMGEPLDNLHEEQRRRPVDGQSNDVVTQARGEEHVIAAPYDPWRDKLDRQPPRKSQAHNPNHHQYSETG
ncbi:MAG: hypothetical protein Q9174_003375 [Haloplaca sp. 1 TL-2023]